MSKLPERNIKFWRGCLTHGLVSNFNHCGDNNCKQCNHLNKILCEYLKEESEKKTDLSLINNL